MIDYSDVEEFVRKQLRAYFSEELTDAVCVASDTDSMFQNMLTANSDYGCIIDYGGGAYQTRHPFTKQVWSWLINGLFFVRFTGDQADTDRRLRNIINRLPKVFDSDRRLFGQVALITLNKIGEPNPGNLNEVPYYALYFGIEVIVKE